MESWNKDILGVNQIYMVIYCWPSTWDTYWSKWMLLGSLKTASGVQVGFLLLLASPSYRKNLVSVDCGAWFKDSGLDPDRLIRFGLGRLNRPNWVIPMGSNIGSVLANLDLDQD